MSKATGMAITLFSHVKKMVTCFQTRERIVYIFECANFKVRHIDEKSPLFQKRAKQHLLGGFNK